MEKNRKRENTYKNLRDDKKEVLVKDNKNILKPVWKKNVSSYFWRVGRVGLPVTKNKK